MLLRSRARKFHMNQRHALPNFVTAFSTKREFHEIYYVLNELSGLCIEKMLLSSIL